MDGSWTLLLAALAGLAIGALPLALVASRLARARAEAQADARAQASRVATLEASLEAERRNAGEKIALLQEARTSLADQFRSLASELLEEKSRRFTEQNQSNLGSLLEPLRLHINEFRAKVEEIHGKDIEQQTTLRLELDRLREINQQMSTEARELATALRGQSKKQGNWGELILANVLERSGLREGVDFRREVSFETAEQRRRPDVIVYLPQQRHLVIDAKVSLNAYTRYVNADDEIERREALREHVAAVAARIRELGERNYFALPGLSSPDMVFLFVPVESAFVEALRADETLFQQALEQNVLVATPTTLLTSLNIVRQLWRFESQNANSAALAERAAQIYRKLGTFLASMDTLGKQLDRAKDSFNGAMGQLYSGRGNLIAQAKEFERLGVAVQGSLPEALVAKAELELPQLPAEPAEGAISPGEGPPAEASR
jgi:DNA recombination protein RmuC